MDYDVSAPKNLYVIRHIANLTCHSFQRTSYVMRCNLVFGLISGCGVLLISALLSATAPAGEAASPPQPELLTNLFQLREEAEHERLVVHPFRIVADVMDADSKTGVLLLRDASGVEFIRGDFGAQDIEPGATVCLEGTGNALKVKSFGLSVAPGMVVRVLATPPWWTLKRLFVIGGMLALLLCAVLIWNKALRRQVQQRTRKLETEIRNRQRAELQQAAEAERSRIARDLHDELGTGLTEVSLLASAGLGQFQDTEKIRNRFHAIAEKARALVSGLDVIVWAIDPKRNSLQSFADYLGGYARELFSSTAIVCRLRIRMESDVVALAEAARHSLFLAVKEALNNVIRHASATEVELHISQLDDRLHIVITDNGRGFDWNAIQRGNGLANLQERLQAMRGECRFDSHPGSGTTVRFIVPLGPPVGPPVDKEPHKGNSIS
jgi:signal transduction histidine kinase